MAMDTKVEKANKPVTKMTSRDDLHCRDAIDSSGYRRRETNSRARDGRR